MSNEINAFSRIFYFLLIFSVLPLTSLRRSVTTVAIPAIKVGVAYMDGGSNLRVCHAPQGVSQIQSCHNERRRVFVNSAAFWQGSHYYCPAIVCISFNHIRLIASASFSPSNLCPMSFGCKPSAKFSFPSGVLGLRSPSFQKSTDFRPYFSTIAFSAL